MCAETTTNVYPETCLGTYPSTYPGTYASAYVSTYNSAYVSATKRDVAREETFSRSLRRTGNTGDVMLCQGN